MGTPSWERFGCILGCAKRRVTDGALVSCATLNASLVKIAGVTSIFPISISYAHFTGERQSFILVARVLGDIVAR
jgi:hypothetical protein